MSEKHCDCPGCRVVVDVEPAGCGHELCFICRRPDHACEACHPDVPWTEERAFDWLVSRYRGQTVEWAATDIKACAAWISSGQGGGSGPHSPRYETRNHKVSLWPPESKDYREPAPFRFTIEALLREAVRRAQLQDAPAAVAAGTYAGPDLQPTLL